MAICVLHIFILLLFLRRKNKSKCDILDCWRWFYIYISDIKLAYDAVKRWLPYFLKINLNYSLWMTNHKWHKFKSFNRMNIDIHVNITHIFLFLCLWIYVPLENFSLTWRRDHYRWRTLIFSALMTRKGSLACHT